MVEEIVNDEDKIEATSVSVSYSEETEHYYESLFTITKIKQF